MTDITGKRYGRLTVIAPDAPCDCGTVFTAYRGNLASGMTRSCGCLRRETMLKNRRNRKYEQNV